MTDIADAIRLFGVNPNEVGIRPRSWWIEDDQLWCSARDPGMNCIDESVFTEPNYDHYEVDDFDQTYCYYIFNKLEEAKQ